MVSVMPKAAVCVGLNAPLEIHELELESPRAGEVMVRMGASGVCHSDLSIQNGTLMGAFPMVLGHEGAGEIVELGEGVEGLEVGDHVVVSWVPQCGECYFCRHGQGYLCEAGAMAMATGGLIDGTTRFSRDGAPVKQMACSGTFSELAVIPAIGAVKIPKDIPFDIAALIGCGVLTGVGAALNTADIQEGDTVAVIGCGGVGLNVIQGAALANAYPVVAIDLFDNKLEQARAFGATHLVNARTQDAAEVLKELSRGAGLDATVDTTGDPGVIQTAYGATSNKGRTILAGVPHHTARITIDSFPLHFGRRIFGSHGGETVPDEDIARYIQLYKLGKLKLQELITHRFPLDDVNQAVDTVRRGEAGRCFLDMA